MIDVVVGLGMMYFVFSLVCSGVNEFIAGLTQRRARFLREGIENLLGKDWTQRLYRHALVDGLGRTKHRARMPSYISAQTFARVVIQTISPTDTDTQPRATKRALETTLRSIKQRHAREALLTLHSEVQGDVQRFKQEVERWFNDSMDRVTGWYKRHTNRIVFAIALSVTAILNADTITVTTTLWSNPALRSAIVAQTEALVEQGEQPQTPTQIRKVVGDLPLPMGWRLNTDESDPRRPPSTAAGWAFKVFGIVLTAAALTLGAPFWFDLLTRIVNIRSAGGKPRDRASPEE
ncbi:MAG TPA: hypothetical protein VM600_07765 [Actinomycetota bacterium]|nr:hypothetical protein [Actinomycetota bacterium]